MRKTVAQNFMEFEPSLLWKTASNNIDLAADLIERGRDRFPAVQHTISEKGNQLTMNSAMEQVTAAVKAAVTEANERTNENAQRTEAEVSTVLGLDQDAATRRLLSPEKPNQRR